MFNKQDTDTEKKISANDAIVAMISAVNAGKLEMLYETAETYSNQFVRGSGTAWNIQRAINNRPRQFKSLDDLDRSVKGLLIQRNQPDKHFFLTPMLKSFIDELVFEIANAETYHFHNLGIRNKILLHGPTGNGKTTLARHIAKLIDKPFVEINSDMVVDSKLGETGQNIWNIFDSIKQPCVLFWDEVDSIGRKRSGSDNAAAFENDRMVNAMLTNIEKMSDEVIFIGATNRMDILDTAFIRRFDIKLEIPGPTEEEKIEFAKQLLEFYKLPEAYADGNLTNYKSYSDVKLHFVDNARKYVTDKLKKNDQT
jgi:SpoVK/Ycf46/Vps4 family AAA+-type ATPase